MYIPGSLCSTVITSLGLNDNSFSSFAAYSYNVKTCQMSIHNTHVLSTCSDLGEGAVMVGMCEFVAASEMVAPYTTECTLSKRTFP